MVLKNEEKHWTCKDYSFIQSNSSHKKAPMVVVKAYKAAG